MQAMHDTYTMCQVAIRLGGKIKDSEKGKLCDRNDIWWGVEGGNKAVLWGKNISGSENSTCKGPGVEVEGTFWKNSMALMK